MVQENEKFVDPIVEETRRARARLEEKIDKSGLTFAEYIRQAGRKHPERLVNRGPRPVERPKSKTG